MAAMALTLNLVTVEIPCDTRIVLSDGSWSLGRSRKCHVRVQDTTISRKHARLHVKQSQLQVIDLDSSNGTYVDGVRVRAARVLDGQRIRFGRVVFLLETTDADTEDSKPEEPTGPCQGTDEHEVTGRTLDLKVSRAQQTVLQLLLQGKSE